MINMADCFVIYDEVQYTKNDWRNRNKIKTSTGAQWLTIPVKQNALSQRIDETHTQNISWQKKHWNALCINYSKSKYFDLYRLQFENFYLHNKSTNLSEINFECIKQVNEILDIKTKIIYSTSLNLPTGKTEKLVAICKHLNATTYISGPAAKAYLNVSLFSTENIQVEWMDYANYLEYSQLYPPFEHAVSILDLIFNEGPNSKHYLKSFV
jgi:archaellin